MTQAIGPGEGEGVTIPRDVAKEIADYLHDAALLADSEADQLVGGQRNRLKAEAAECRRWRDLLTTPAKQQVSV